MKPDHRKFISENYRKKTSNQIAKQLGLKERTVSRYIDSLKQKQSEKVELEVKDRKKKVPKVKMFWPYLIVIALIGFFVYFNMLKGQFIWDDHILVTNNTDIRSWDNLGKVLTGNL
jgi:DNA-binding transcriptional regulator LsrR (DeoR family)